MTLSDGVSIKAGEEVALLLGAANHCMRKFESPELLEPDRADDSHLSLGAGIHFCVGAPLAKLELRVALSVLFERLPGLRLAEEPTYRNSFHFHGLQSLQVEW